MKILFIGDIFGAAGREVVAKLLPALISEHAVDIVIGNGENAAAGRGIHPRQVAELRAAGVDFMTSGNHVFDVKEIAPLLNDPKGGLLRPVNYPKRSPGRGYAVTTDRRGVPIAIVNVMGRIFMDPVDCPFQAMDDVLASVRHEAKVIFVDFHAEASSEARAFGWYLSGKVSAVVGTHRHVQTADEELLDGVTAYITDVGMTGPYRSVIGMEIATILKKFTTKFSQRPEPATDDVRLCGVVIEVNDSTGKAVSIKRVQQRL